MISLHPIFSGFFAANHNWDKPPPYPAANSPERRCPLSCWRRRLGRRACPGHYPDGGVRAGMRKLRESIRNMGGPLSRPTPPIPLLPSRKEPAAGGWFRRSNCSRCALAVACGASKAGGAATDLRGGNSPSLRQPWSPAALALAAAPQPYGSILRPRRGNFSRRSWRAAGPRSCRLPRPARP